MGRTLTFVARHGLWSDEQQEAARRLRRIVEEKNLEVIRLAFPDQHGILRGKTLIAAEALALLESGCTITTTMLAKVTSHRTVFPVFTAGGGFGMKEMEGAADVLMVPDPLTFRVLPWSPSTGWLLCDIHFADGRPVPFATRHLFKSVLDKLGARGYDFVAGLEVEFHIFKLDDAKMSPENAGQPGEPPAVSLLSHGYQYLTEQRYDLMEPALEIIRRDVLALGLPLRSVEVEFGPSQCEFTFQPRKGRGRRQHGPVPQRRETDRAAAWLSRHLHVPAETAQRICVRLASASVADGARRRRQCLHGQGNRQGRRRTALCARQILSRRLAGACARLGGVLDTDHQRL
jgi:glutamine synthetase